MAVTPSNYTSFSLVSPYRLATNNVQCLQFRYIFPGSSKAQLLFKLHRENSESTKVSMEGTRTWKNFLYQIEEKFDFLVFILDTVHPHIDRDEAAGIDDVKVSTGTCIPVGEFLCPATKWHIVLSCVHTFHISTLYLLCLQILR